MFKTMMTKVFFNQKVVAATDIFNSLQRAAQDTRGKLMLIAAIFAVVSLIIGGLFFLFGRRGAENGKSHIGNVLLGVIIVVAAASIVLSLFTLFGQNPQGI